jgi:hypothetical protein
MDQRVESVARYKRRTLCSFEKGCGFQGDFVRRKERILREARSLAIENFLYVIIYPHAIELFALRKDRCTLQSRVDLRVRTDGPP